MKKLLMKLLMLSLVSIVSVQAMGGIKEKCKTAAQYAVANASYYVTSYVPQAYEYTYADIPVGAIAMNTANVASAGYQVYRGYKLAQSYAHDSVSADVDAYYHAVVQKVHAFNKDDDNAQQVNRSIDELSEAFIAQVSSKINNIDDVRTHVMTLKAIIASAFDQKIRRGLHDKELIDATSIDMALFHASKACKNITDTIKIVAQESIVGVAKSAIVDAKNKVLKHPYKTAAAIVTGLNVVLAASYAALS